MKKAAKSMWTLLVILLAISVMTTLTVTLSCGNDDTGLPPKKGTNSNTGTQGQQTGTNNNQQTGTNNNQQTGTNNNQQTGTNNQSDTGTNVGDYNPDDNGGPNVDGVDDAMWTVDYKEITVHQWQVPDKPTDFQSVVFITNKENAKDVGYIEIDWGNSPLDVAEVFGSLNFSTKAKDYDGVTFQIKTNDDGFFLVVLRAENTKEGWRLMENSVKSNGAWKTFRLPFSGAGVAWGSPNQTTIGGANIKTWLGESGFRKFLYIMPSRCEPKIKEWANYQSIKSTGHQSGTYQLRNIGFYKGSQAQATSSTILWKPSDAAGDNEDW